MLVSSASGLKEWVQKAIEKYDRRESFGLTINDMKSSAQ
jgi:hypothetical protein